MGKDFFKIDRIGGMAARRLALASLLASDAQEAIVTLSYHPGGDRPASVSLLLDGRPSDGVIVPEECGRLECAGLHRVFSRFDASLIELARWGHQTEGATWELLRIGTPDHKRVVRSVNALPAAGYWRASARPETLASIGEPQSPPKAADAADPRQHATSQVRPESAAMQLMSDSTQPVSRKQ